MPLSTLNIYVTQVVDGIAVGDSVLTTITIDTGADNVIDPAEWQAYLNHPNGHIGGSAAGAISPALWDGGGSGNFTDGVLYTTQKYSDGDNLQSVLRQLKHGKYTFSVDYQTLCFLAGTMIATPLGEVAVESLRAGDLVMTLDNGPQRLVWSGQSRVSAEQLDRCPNLYPVQFEAGSLGGGLPRRAVRLSPQHRVMLRDATGQECLVSARHIQAAGMPGANIVRDKKSFVLAHVACANHEVLLAEGAPMESFFTGPHAMRAMSPTKRMELCKVFPSLREGRNPMVPARPFMGKKAAVDLIAAITC